MINCVASVFSLIAFLGVMVSGIASGAEFKIENRLTGVPAPGCSTPIDTSMIRLQVQGNHMLTPLRTDSNDGTTPSYPASGSKIDPDFDSVTFHTTTTTYRVVIEMGSWSPGGLGGVVQRRYMAASAAGGCDIPRYRYLDFTVTNQGPGLLTLRVRPTSSGNQYEVVVQGGTATLSTTPPGQKTTTDFTTIDGPYIPTNAPPVLNVQQFSVAENSAVGTVVGTVVAIDPDGGPLTYSVTGGTGQGVFAVNPTTGQITVLNNSQLDFETRPNFTLQVQVTDNGTPQLSASATITINLTNNNEVSPLPPANLRIQ